MVWEVGGLYFYFNKKMKNQKGKNEWKKIQKVFRSCGNPWLCYGQVYLTAHSTGIFLGQSYDRAMRRMRSHGLIESRDTGRGRVKEFRLTESYTAPKFITQKPSGFFQKLKLWFK